MTALATQFDDLEQSRIEALQLLLSELNAADPESREEFAVLFGRAQKMLEIDDAALAGMLRVSRPTIGRWARGESAPHRFMRKPVLDVLATTTRSRLRLHK